MVCCQLDVGKLCRVLPASFYIPELNVNPYALHIFISNVKFRDKDNLGVVELSSGSYNPEFDSIHFTSASSWRFRRTSKNCMGVASVAQSRVK